MTAYEFKSESFTGPLSKLLTLIEERKLEVTTVSLSEVTADFLEYLSALQDENRLDPRTLTDFIWIASKLILIKSKAILPNLEITEEEEAEIKELEERLKIYREFDLGKANIKSLFREEEKSFRRKYLPPAFFFPPEDLMADDLKRAVEKLTQSLQFTKEIQSGKIEVFNFEEKLQQLSSRIQKELQASFSILSKDTSRTETIVLFLVVLHLLKENLIAFKQDKQFSDIVITSTNGNRN